MRIALVHHGRYPVTGYGGTERVVQWLARGLAEAGHEVTLLAAPGSHLSEARVIPVPPRLADRPFFDVRPWLPPGIDLVHAHQEIIAPDVPWVWTLHGNLQTPRTLPPNTIGLSADHARRHALRHFVYNGLDPDELRFQPRKADYDLFLGRLHTIKGWKWAVAGARRTRRRLILAGGWKPVLSRYVRLAGPVDGARKAELLAGARFLWMPALWDEPFGLTLIEALASGTPVLGTRRGSLPEIVTPEVGELADTLDALIDRIPAMATKDPVACRDRVVSHFHYRTMTAAYLERYRATLADAG